MTPTRSGRQANQLRLSASDLDSDQLAAVTAPRGPLCILAGAGTGKTRTVTHRIVHLISNGFVAPSQVLAVTFTTRAAGEMRERLHIMGAGNVQTRTFHAAARGQLKYFWPQIAGDLPWRLESNKFPIVARAVRAAQIDANTDTIADILREIEWAKATLISAADYESKAAALHRETPIPAEKIARVYQLYEKSKTSPEGVVLDFDDLLLHTAGAMENNPGVAEEFRARYRSFVVDEYQDVTPLQQRVLKAWLGPRDDLTVVGDANQTIYSFTGADPRYLLDFTRTYENATLIRLQRDYRSTPQVVELANKVISRAVGRVAGTRLELVGQRPPGPPPTFEQFDDETQEASVVVRRIRRLIEAGTRPSQIAILFRINAQSEAYEHALDEANIPYRVQGGQSFYHRPEVRQALNALMRVATAQAKEDIHHTGSELTSDVHRVLADCGLTPDEPNGAQARERWESLRALLQLTTDTVEAAPETDLQQLMVMLRGRAETRNPPSVEGITLATIHAAKGLEWDAVFLVGLVDGMIPYRKAIEAGPEAIEEERRLLYVAITRAREHLHLSWSLARQAEGRKTRSRSRFLDGIAPESSSVQGPRKARRAVCSGCGAALTSPTEKVLGHCENCAPPVDQALVEELRSWRLTRSQQQGTPAFTVFSDATLAAIAETKPTTEAELLGISGIGPAKLELYGPEILAIVRSFDSPDATDSC